MLPFNSNYLKTQLSLLRGRASLDAYFHNEFVPLKLPNPNGRKVFIKGDLLEIYQGIIKSRNKNANYHYLFTRLASLQNLGGSKAR